MALELGPAGDPYVAGGRGYETLHYDTSGQIVWTRRYEGRDSLRDTVSALEVDASGNVYLTGVIDWSSGYNSIWGGNYGTVKYNASGELAWDRSLDGPMHLYDKATDIKVDGAGNVFVTGMADRDCGFLPCFGGHSTTVKYDSGGLLLWTYQHEGPVVSTVALDIDSLSNVYVAGTLWDSMSRYDYVIFKCDSQGNLLWERRYDGPAHLGDGATALVLDASGAVVVTGQSTGEGGLFDIVTLKYDALGTPLWEARLDGPYGGPDDPNALFVDLAGNVYVAGTSSTGSGSASDYVTLKYDPHGVLLWARYYDGPTHGPDVAYGLDVDTLGNVYVTGESNSSGFSLGADYLTLKYDASGNLLWEARYNTGFNLWDVAMAVRADDGGHAYVTGTSGDSIVTIKYAPCSVAASGDSDGDGLADDCDNCPEHANADQADVDADAVGDSCDNCPGTFNQGQTDLDADQVGDSCDNCPEHANSDQVDSDGDGAGDACDPRMIDVPGDVNVNGLVSSSDIIFVVNFVFKSGPTPLPCEAAADADCSGAVTSTDIIHLIDFVFKSGPPPCPVNSLIPLKWSCPPTR